MPPRTPMFPNFRARQPGASLFSLCFYALVARSVQLMFRVFYATRAEHKERIPRTGSLLIVANHLSYIDPPAISSSITGVRHLDFIARAGLFKVPVFGSLIRALNAIPVKGTAADVDSIRELLAHLGHGRAVLIFPEGARSLDGNLQEFKRGATLLIRKAKCTVIPAAITGAHEAWPPQKKLPRIFGQRVRVRFGNPIAPDELMKDGPDAAMQRLHDEVRDLLAEMRESPQAAQ